jgi:hypothetical protein
MRILLHAYNVFNVHPSIGSWFINFEVSIGCSQQSCQLSFLAISTVTFLLSPMSVMIVANASHYSSQICFSLTRGSRAKHFCKQCGHVLDQFGASFNSCSLVRLLSLLLSVGLADLSFSPSFGNMLLNEFLLGHLGLLVTFLVWLHGALRQHEGILDAEVRRHPFCVCWWWVLSQNCLGHA